MADLNKQALEMWNSMKPMIDREIEQQTKGTVQRRKAKVTTAPSLVTKKIGVTEPFGDQYFIPYDAKVAGANVGDVVWVEYMYGASNAFASMFAKAVEDPRSCSATLSSAGWYRVLKSANVSGSIIHLSVCVAGVAEVHDIDFCISGTLTRFTNELSVGNQSFVDKIRFTTKDTFLYIDVHYSSSSANTVNINFEAFGYAQLGNTTAESLQSVADAPAGETVLVTYNFHKDVSPTVKDISDSITIASPTWVSMSKIATIHNGIVDVQIEVNTGETITPNYMYAIGNIASAYRPKTYTFCTGHSTDGSYNPKSIVTGKIDYSTGDISIDMENTDGTYFFLHFTYSIF